jgi:ABC-type molybdate transport system ATPase subunit
MQESKNVRLSLDGNTLVIRVDLTKDYGLSGSGKTNIVATSAGFMRVPGREEISVGLNVVRKPDSKHYRQEEDDD